MPGHAINYASAWSIVTKEKPRNQSGGISIITGECSAWSKADCYRITISCSNIFAMRMSYLLANSVAPKAMPAIGPSTRAILRKAYPLGEFIIFEIVL